MNMISRWPVVCLVLMTALIFSRAFRVGDAVEPTEPAESTEPIEPADTEDNFESVVAPFLASHCVKCHGEEPKDNELRLDVLGAGNATETQNVETWQSMLERLELGDMPPEEERRPDPTDTDRVIGWLQEQLRSAGRESGGFGEMDYPRSGNHVDHDLLFGEGAGVLAEHASTASEPRLWRVSPFIYMGVADHVTDGGATFKRRPNSIPAIRSPWGLTTDPVLRDYAFRYSIGGPETQKLAANAKVMMELMVGQEHHQELTTIASMRNGEPTVEQIQSAISAMFTDLLLREPSPEELDRYTQFVGNSIELLGNHRGIIHGLTPVFFILRCCFALSWVQAMGTGKIV